MSIPVTTAIPKEVSEQSLSEVDRVLVSPLSRFKPILDRVLVRRSAVKNASSIAIPEQYQQQSNEGVVVAIGDCVVLGNRVLPLSKFVRIGDKVRFGEYNAEVFDEKEQLVLVRIQDIRGRESQEARDEPPDCS